MRFSQYRIPVAFSMVRYVDTVPDDQLKPLIAFASYWMAFNNIYVQYAIETRLADGIPELRRDARGIDRLERVAHVQIAKVKPAKEFKQIHHAVMGLEPTVKAQLLSQEVIDRFAVREPRFSGGDPPVDPLHQKINGVLNVGYTAATGRSVWAPIDPALLARFRAGAASVKDSEDLLEQIARLLYTVRNNTFHGGKEQDDSNDERVLWYAFTLLRIVVEGFMA